MMKKIMLRGLVSCISILLITGCVSNIENAMIDSGVVTAATISTDVLQTEINTKNVGISTTEIDITEINEKTNSENNTETNKKWFEDNDVIAHALGSIDGRVETNSLEAFLSSYEKGVRVFEADFQITNDGVLVVRHDFEQDSYYRLEQTVLDDDTSMSIDRYVNEKINFKYTPLTASGLVELLNEYKDAYIVTDTKDFDSETTKKQFELLVEAIKEIDCPEILDRIIVQIYNMDMLYDVREVYDFDNWIFTLYQLQNPDFEQIGTFCENEGIEVVTMNQSIINRDISDILHSHNIKIYTHTVNRLLDLRHAKYVGAHGVYSDFLTPSDVDFLYQ